jgi:hypothetical protein
VGLSTTRSSELGGAPYALSDGTISKRTLPFLSILARQVDTSSSSKPPVFCVEAIRFSSVNFIGLKGAIESVHSYSEFFARETWPLCFLLLRRASNMTACKRGLKFLPQTSTPLNYKSPSRLESAMNCLHGTYATLGQQ